MGAKAECGAIAAMWPWVHMPCVLHARGRCSALANASMQGWSIHDLLALPSLPGMQISGWWSSGLPYLDAALKATPHSWRAGLQLPLLVANVTALKAAVLAQEPSFWTQEGAAAENTVMRGREQNQVCVGSGMRAGRVA